MRFEKASPTKASDVPAEEPAVATAAQDDRVAGINNLFKAFRPGDPQPHGMQAFLCVQGFSVDDATAALESWRTTGQWVAPNGTTWGELKG